MWTNMFYCLTLFLLYPKKLCIIRSSSREWKDMDPKHVKFCWNSNPNKMTCPIAVQDKKSFLKNIFPCFLKTMYFSICCCCSEDFAALYSDSLRSWGTLTLNDVDACCATAGMCLDRKPWTVEGSASSTSRACDTAIRSNPAMSTASCAITEATEGRRVISLGQRLGPGWGPYGPIWAHMGPILLKKSLFFFNKMIKLLMKI